ncbi:MAG TPA: maleylpyruvate isomerase family mycothiol-dependent enzyme [Mycobacteriales bacterium]|nr:maleylpyruvate isomerase family mycothiol-dependent enzyme [Mycobacteriales bacterium]
MDAIVADFVAESDALDALLATLSDEQWLTGTPAEGWDVRDSVTHLAFANELADEIARTGRSEFMEAALAGGDLDALEREHLARGRTMAPAEVLTWWRQTVGVLADSAANLTHDQRVPWGPMTMSSTSFMTGRLMETWAHGLDCFDAVGQESVDTDRLHHVAHLGLSSLPYAFMLRGLPAPGAVQLILDAPDGSVWRLGRQSAPSVIEGTAGDWCRVAVRRDRRGERERLRGIGPDAKAIIDNVQAYLAAPTQQA